MKITNMMSNEIALIEWFSNKVNINWMCPTVYVDDATEKALLLKIDDGQQQVSLGVPKSCVMVSEDLIDEVESGRTSTEAVLTRVRDGRAATND